MLRRVAPKKPEKKDEKVYIEVEVLDIDIQYPSIGLVSITLEKKDTAKWMKDRLRVTKDKEEATFKLETAIWWSKRTRMARKEKPKYVPGAPV